MNKYIRKIFENYQNGVIDTWVLGLSCSDNLRVREAVFKESDVNIQRGLWFVFSESTTAFVSLCGWVHEPRAHFGGSDEPYRPFILYDYQSKLLTECDECLDDMRPMAIVKSRSMGISWSVLAYMHHRWKFVDDQSFLLASMGEKEVDFKGSMSSLMPKLVSLEKHLPNYLKSNCRKTHLMYENLDNGSFIQGTSTKNDMSRSGRFTMVVFDEFASVDNNIIILESLVSVSSFMVFISTPKGNTDGFYSIAHNDAYHQVRLHWSQHPIYNIGMTIDKEGKKTSPWYEEACELLGNNSVAIARELDGCFTASNYQFFDQSLVDKLIVDCVPALWRGELLDIDGRHELMDNENGIFSIWEYVNDDDSYAIGCDIGMGTGVSNSVGSVVNLRTGEKVCELATALSSPYQFARLCIILANYYNKALIIHETNGPGANFTSEILDNQYYRLYNYSGKENLVNKKTLRVGWHSRRETKYDLFFNYQKALVNQLFVNYCNTAVLELSQYILDNNRSLIHVGSKTEDPSGAKDNHGDRVVADALACKYFLEFNYKEPSHEEEFDMNTARGQILSRRREKLHQENRKTNDKYHRSVFRF